MGTTDPAPVSGLEFLENPKMSIKNFARAFGMHVEKSQPVVKRDRGLDLIPAKNPGFAQILKEEPKTKVNHSACAWDVRRRGLFI